MLYDLMMWDTKIGEFEIQETEKRNEMKITCPDLNKIPLDMRLRFENSNQLDTDEVMEWILDRIIPETQEGVLDNLNSIGIKSYNPLAILKFIDGCSMSDQIWVKFNKDATYTSTHSWRDLSWYTPDYFPY